MLKNLPIEDRLTTLETEFKALQDKLNSRLTHFDDELKVAFSDISGTFKYLMERVDQPAEEETSVIVVK